MPPTIHLHDWYDLSHHRPGGGFQNVWDPPEDVPTLKTMQWILGRVTHQKSNIPPPLRSRTRDWLHPPSDRLRLAWAGHSTMLIQTPAITILTDPMFSERASPIGFAGPARLAGLPFRLQDLPAVDVVLISHNHYDHLDEASIKTLRAAFDPLFLVPLGLADLLHRWGARSVVELDWWQYVALGELRCHCTPAKHFSGRSLFDRNATLWASWYLDLLDVGRTLFYGGDTGYSSHFVDIKTRLGAPDLALLPIGAYRPRWFMARVHMDPAESVQAFLDLEAEHFIPIHWGTFDLADEPLHEPPTLAMQAAGRHGLNGRLHVLDIGGSFVLE